MGQNKREVKRHGGLAEQQGSVDLLLQHTGWTPGRSCAPPFSCQTTMQTDPKALAPCVQLQEQVLPGSAFLKIVPHHHYSFSCMAAPRWI